MNLRLWEDGTDRFIHLPHGGPHDGFAVSDLVAHLQSSGRNYIIQGQQNCKLAEHTKPQSLDVWLRENHTRRKDTTQAVNSLVDALVATGRFEVAHLECPDSGRRCKGLKLVDSRV
jgi:hypothetical protein